MMGLLAKDSGGGDFEQAPMGNHTAICYQVIDLGIQYSEYLGQPTSAHQVFIAWELSSELMGDGKPFTINNFYTLSLSKKSHLRPMLESWRGKAFTEQELDGFDLNKIVGTPCMVNVIHKANKVGNMRARVGSVSPLPKGMAKPTLCNTPIFYSIDDDRNGAVFNALPDWLKKKINRQAPEPEYDQQEPPNYDDFDDQVPF